MNPENISPSKFAGVINLGSPTAEGPRKPWRHLHHDYQPIDEVRIITVPRYKTSGLSGDEWRISATIQYLKKGVVVHELGCRNIESALRFGDWWLVEWLEQGNFSAGRFDHQCDQEGCNEPATVTYRLKARYDRDSGTKQESYGEHIIRFCERHRRRGDCGIEDSDANYEQVELNEDGTIKA